MLRVGAVLRVVLWIWLVLGLGSRAEAQTNDHSVWQSRVSFGWLLPKERPVIIGDGAVATATRGASALLEVTRVVTSDFDAQLAFGTMSIPIEFASGPSAPPIASNGLRVSTLQFGVAYHFAGRRVIDPYVGGIVSGSTRDVASAELTPGRTVTLNVPGTWGAGLQFGARFPGCTCKGTFALDVNAKVMRWRVPVHGERLFDVSPWNIAFGIIYMH